MTETAQDTAIAQPSKSFFVNMLVRDIELGDTLLDLLDNCVDGILRNTDPDPSEPRPYKHYYANFVIGPELFQLEDNCGGIPIDLARRKAFAIGKPEPITGLDAKATVGMYGIGMKRAIFKLGQNAAVRSWSDQPFIVTIDSEWLRNDNWDPLPIEHLQESEFERRGTTVSVKELYLPIANEFRNKTFLTNFARRVSSIYALIIEKGFTVTVRGSVDEPVPSAIEAKPFLLLSSEPGSGGLAPIVYKGTINDVEVELFAGIYRNLPDEVEQDLDEAAKNRTDDAGWSVACNDRIVIDKDRTWITGWGEGAVPNFHNQFIAITGIVLLRSSDPHLLPLTTTKRGVDHGTAIYSTVKDMMREATKKLTDFTNKWKKSEADLADLYKRETSPKPLSAIRDDLQRIPARTWPKDKEVQVYAQTLPTPKKESSSARISFVAAKQDVQKLSMVYFGETGAKAKDVGERAFKEELGHYAEAAE